MAHDDPVRNQIWKQNNTEYHLGGIPIRWAEPFATPVMMISDMAHLSNQMRPDNVTDFVAAMSLSFERAISNNYWLRTMEGITNAISGVEDARKPEEWMLALGKVGLQPVMTIGTAGVVGSPVGRRFREMFDPEVKDIRNLTEYFISQVPGYSKNIRPRLNYSAKPIEIPPTIGGRWLSFFLPPLRPKSGEEDPVGGFLEAHDLKLTDSWKTYGGYDPEKPLRDPTTSEVGVPLIGDQSYNWKLLSLDGVMLNGKTWKERIAELNADPTFAARKTASKQEKVSLLYNRYRHEGWKALKQQDPISRRWKNRLSNLQERIAGA